MKLLLVHNHYQLPGGEDSVFTTEVELLRHRGHEVATLEESNEPVLGDRPLGIVRDAFWSRSFYQRLRRTIRDFRPDLVHFHNTFFRISPSAYWACKREGVPLVQTLHNYRLACVNGMLFREGRPCELCLGRRVAWPGVLHRCYHDSFSHSALVASVSALHWALGTYKNKVDAFVALSRFSRDKILLAGLPAAKIHINGNFVHPDPGLGGHEGGYALYVGRLSPEKGLACLLEAWAQLLSPFPLKIAGGPLEPSWRDRSPAGVEFLGPMDHPKVLALMQDAALLVFPSQYYESFPVTIAEAFATGLPVVAADLGAMAEIVDAETGSLFRPGSPDSLAEAVREALESREALREKGRRARQRYLERYSADSHYARLMEIYQAARGGAGSEA